MDDRRDVSGVTGPPRPFRFAAEDARDPLPERFPWMEFERHAGSIACCFGRSKER